MKNFMCFGEGFVEGGQVKLINNRNFFDFRVGYMKAGSHSDPFPSFRAGMIPRALSWLRFH